VLRQPHAQLTNHKALDECYVFTFDQDVSQAVEGVRKGLQDEGMADLASSVKAVGGSGSKQRLTKKVTLNRRDAFTAVPTVFLPKVLARDVSKSCGYRLLDYDRDILGELAWYDFRYLQADSHKVEEQEKLTRTIARVDLDQKKDDDLFSHVMLDDIPDEGLDVSFLVRQLLDVVPNPWQGMRILEDTLMILRGRGVSEQRLYVNRLELLKAMKLDLKQQVESAAEKLFREKLEKGDISLKLVSSGDAKLNWELAKTLEVDVSDEDRLLYRKDGGDIEKSLFEKVYQRDFNDLEKDTALYLDTRQSVYWWHRIAVNQRSYSLQGWQRNKVYPDFLVCIHAADNSKFRFSLLETKGEHLKGNDDTEYKRKMFELLTTYVDTAIRAGELDLGESGQQITFTMLMENSWQQQAISTGIV